MNRLLAAAFWLQLLQVAVGVALIVTHWHPLFIAYWPIVGLTLCTAFAGFIGVAWPKHQA